MRSSSCHLCAHRAQVSVLCPCLRDFTCDSSSESYYPAFPPLAAPLPRNCLHRYDGAWHKQQRVNVLPGKKPIWNRLWPNTLPGLVDWPTRSTRKYTNAIGMNQAEGGVHSVPGKTNTQSREKSLVPRISAETNIILTPSSHPKRCTAPAVVLLVYLITYPSSNVTGISYSSPTVRADVYSTSTSKSTAILNPDPVDDVASINTVSDVGPVTRGLRPRPNTKRLTTSRMAPYLLTWNRLTTGSYTNATCKYTYHSRSAQHLR
jgi:hypothetical protein